MNMNRFYDWLRSPEADEVARQSGQSGGFDTLAKGKYALLVTFKRSGDPVATPVWFALDEAGRMYVHTERDSAKVKRVRNDPHVRVAASNVRGKPRGPVIEGRARVVAPDEEEHAEAALRSHYGVVRRVFEGALGSSEPMVYIEVSPAGQEVAA